MKWSHHALSLRASSPISVRIWYLLMNCWSNVTNHEYTIANWSYLISLLTHKNFSLTHSQQYHGAKLTVICDPIIAWPLCATTSTASERGKDIQQIAVSKMNFLRYFVRLTCFSVVCPPNNRSKVFEHSFGGKVTRRWRAGAFLRGMRVKAEPIAQLQPLVKWDPFCNPSMPAQNGRNRTNISRFINWNRKITLTPIILQTERKNSCGKEIFCSSGFVKRFCKPVSSQIRGVTGFLLAARSNANIV